MLLRALTILIVGLALVVIAFLVLDIELTRRIVGGFVVLPIGALLIALALRSIVGRYVCDE